MTATFISGFSKRRNSTKRPSGGTSKTVVLKDNTSLMKPAFLLSTVTWSWNYCVWNGNYYWITDIVQEANALFRVECEMDVLATFKVSIGNYSTLIARAASDQNFNVIDTIYPAKAVPITKRTQITNPGIFTPNINAGTIVMATVGKDGQHYYLMDMTRFRSVCYWLFPALGMDFNTWSAMNIQQALAGGLNTILQNITALKWLPITYSTISGMLTATSSTFIGNWEMPHANSELTGSLSARILGTLISFADRDDAGARGKWLYQAPFASYSVYIPPFGKIEVDGQYLVSAGRQIVADIMADLLGGNVTLRLYYSTGQSGPKMLGVYNANVGYNMEAGGAAMNFGGIASSIASAAVSYAAGNKMAALSSIASAATSFIPGGAQIGGGIAGPAPDIGETWFADATYFDPIDENQAELGRPLGEVKAISTLSGYVQCADASLSMPGHEIEMIKVNDFLNGGFFYE